MGIPPENLPRLWERGKLFGFYVRFNLINFELEDLYLSVVVSTFTDGMSTFFALYLPDTPIAELSASF